jgi:hypothetical protein
MKYHNNFGFMDAPISNFLQLIYTNNFSNMEMQLCV